MKRWLFLKTQGFAYNESEYFMHMLESALTDHGYEVWVRPYSLQNAHLLYRLTDDMKFDGIVEFNSRLPRVKMPDGQYVVDSFNAPFYNAVVVHPLYYHESLVSPCRNHHVTCIDGNHKAYIEKYYKNVKTAHFLPIGTEILYDQKPISERGIDLLFPATYKSPAKTLETIKLQSPEEVRFTMDFIDFLKEHEELTMESALRHYCDAEGLGEMPADEFSKLMNKLFACDRYITAYERERVVTSIISEGFPLTLVGNGWRNFAPAVDAPNVTILDAITYEKTLEFMSDTKVVLNVSPFMKDGIHDRVVCALGRGAVSLTDETTGILREFESEKQILTYDVTKPYSASVQLEKIWGHWDKMQEIADAGYETAAAKFSWNQSVAQLIDYPNSL